MIHKMMMYIFAHTFEGIKLATVLVVAFFSGEATSLIDTAGKYPAFTSALAGIIVALGVRYIDKWLEGRNKTVQTADKVLELEHADKKELREEHGKLMAEKEAWWKLQNDRLKVEAFQERQGRREERVVAQGINHSAINELMRLQNIILGMQRTMVINNLTVPEVAHIDLTKFFLPVWEEERDENTNTDRTEEPTVPTP